MPKLKSVNRLDLNGRSEPQDRVVKLVVPQLNAEVLDIEIVGISPLVIRAWDSKTMQQLEDKQKGVKKVKKRENVDPQSVFNAARYISTEGWDGVPASAFKASLVEAVSCLDISKADFSMTLAKKTFFIRPEGTDKLSGRDLVRIVGAKPEIYKLMQPTSGGGPYMSYRPMYRKWSCRLLIEYNATCIDAQGVLNLLSTAGYFVGVGEHRPSSKKSHTGAFGRWKVLPTK